MSAVSNIFAELAEDAKDEADMLLKQIKDIVGVGAEKSNAIQAPRIFLSYCWDDTDRASIDDYLKEKGIAVTCDIRGVDTWQSYSVEEGEAI